jgi:hypothetical protein
MFLVTLVVEKPLLCELEARTLLVAYFTRSGYVCFTAMAALRGIWEHDTIVERRYRDNALSQAAKTERLDCCPLTGTLLLLELSGGTAQITCFINHQQRST